MYRLIKKGQSGAYLQSGAAPLMPTFPKNMDLGTLNTQLQTIKSGLPEIPIRKSSQNLLGKLGNFTSNSNIPTSSIGNLGSTALNSFLKPAEDKASQIGSTIIQGVGDVASAINPVIGAAVKLFGSVVNVAGPNIKGNTSKELTDQSSSYGGEAKLDNKKFGLFGLGAASKYKNKVANREINRMNTEQILKKAQETNLAAATSVQNKANKYNLSTSGGWQQTGGVRFGKSGIKYDTSFCKKVLEFKSGGKMNVIPSGALHAHKHGISSEELDGNITKKGIPVVYYDGGEVNQAAEIEKNEIIFTKEITDKLEALRKKGTVEASIEAGKLLTTQILYNTQDNTGLIQTIN